MGNNDPLTIKTLEIHMQSHDDLVGSVKLYFSFCTGAAVLLTNAAAQPSTLPLGWQFASLVCMGFSALFFATAAIRAMRSTVRFSTIKSSYAKNLTHVGEEERLGDKWLKESGDKLDSANRELGQMEKAFNIAIALSVLFVLVRILAAASLWLAKPQPSRWPAGLL
jgi:hypothetical protein